MSSLLPFLTGDPDFLQYVGHLTPDALGVLTAYAMSPNCTTCKDRLAALAAELEPQYDALMEGFQQQYHRVPRSATAEAAKVRLHGEFVIKPHEYRDFIRGMAAAHTWTSMRTRVQSDGTWQLRFS